MFLADMFSSLWDFLIIKNFGAFTALLAGAIAWFIYKSQKKDTKMNAARVILAEIRLAEKRIEQVKDLLNRQLVDYPHVLPNNSWRTFSHLFASDFDRDELEEINAFYDICEVVEDAVNRDANYFWKTTDSITQVGQQMTAKIISDSLKPDLSIDSGKVMKLKESVVDSIPSYPFIYAPQKTLNILKREVPNFKKITTSITGQKLKDIAKLSNKKIFGLF